METDENQHHQESELKYPPKPILVQNKKNWVTRSIISLVMYAVFFIIFLQGNPVYVAAVLVVLLIHELGHFFAMKLYGYNDVKLFVLPLLGAYVTGTKSRISQRQMSVIILAGPVPGILLGFAMLMYTLYYPNDRIHMLGNIFLYLNLLNLLPFMPLDGGRLLETLFIRERYIIRMVFSILSIIAMTLVAIVFPNSIIFLLIPVSMIFNVVLEVKNQKIRDYLKQEHINYITDYADLPDKNYWSIRDCLLLAYSTRYKGVEPGVYQYSVAEGAIIQHITSILQTPFQVDVKAFGKLFIMLLYVAMFALPFILIALH
ncbi:MAG: hypothetical protein JST26_00760 [Bacteroidetes bacterium]|nr:hypothetical protein [Bacteroidota bacterium]